MKKRNNNWWVLVCAAFFILHSSFFISCSEDDNTVEEFPNWKETNSKYFNNLYAEATQRIASGDTSWKIMLNWSLQDSLHLDPENYVIAHVIESGTGTTCPIFTDSACVMYSGKLLPSQSYPTGYVFDKTYSGDTFQPETSIVRGFLISSSSLTSGFATVLQYMHVGDRWEVYVPSSLAYGADGNSSSIPGYSTLIFDMTLVRFYHAGETTPVE